MNRDIPKWLIITVIIVGSISFFGATIYKILNNYNHRDYIETTATFIRTNSVCPNDDAQKTYNLMYGYTANGQEYYHITDYCTSVIPKVGSQIKIKYNPITPSQAYSTSFDVFSIFQIIGAFFLFVFLIILFPEWVWFRDIVMFLGTVSLMITFIINHFYTGHFILALIILGIMCFVSIMDFITILKNNNFKPVVDIKREINKSKQLKLIKKETELNLTEEEKTLKNKKSKRIKIAILLLLVLPVNIFIEANGWHLSIITYIISGLCCFVGFCIIGMTLVGAFDDKNTNR